jgi:uncharacterized spore protein YtfJ
MRKRSKSQQRAELQPKNHKKPSMQTVLPMLDKDFDKKLGTLLSVPPSQLKKLKAKWKKEREGKKQNSDEVKRQSSN